MIGAIIGDIVGSRFEFSNIYTKEFELFTDRSRFTDDTVLTIAVMDWACHSENQTIEEASEYLRKWAKKYPRAGYGGMFAKWMRSSNPAPYNSFGNGAAMRISPVGWMFDNVVDLKTASKIITGATHNHPEGLKGAEVVAMCIFLARNGRDKSEIKDYVEQYYKLDYTLEGLRHRDDKYQEICQTSVPQAIWCFLNSKSFEDCLRTTVSIGGDTDTLCAISCSIAEAYYGEIPQYIIDETMKRLPNYMKEIIEDAKWIRNMM